MQLFTLSHFKQHSFTETAVVMSNMAGNAIESATNLMYEPASHTDNTFKTCSNVRSTDRFLISLSFKYDISNCFVQRRLVVNITTDSLSEKELIILFYVCK